MPAIGLGDITVGNTGERSRNLIPKFNQRFIRDVILRVLSRSPIENGSHLIICNISEVGDKCTETFEVRIRVRILSEKNGNYVHMFLSEPG